MTSTAAEHRGSPRSIYTALWILTLLVGAYFIWNNVPRYLVFTEESYGPYFWPRNGYLLSHVLGGLIAIIIGPFQFWSKIRTGYPKVHRVSGRVYLTAILIGSIGGLGLGFTIPEGLAYASGLISLAIAWLATSGMALLAIRKRNFIQHKQWMIRSYVVTFGFVSFRLVDDVMHHFGYGEIETHNAMLAWGCWALPLLVTEMVLQGQQIFRTKRPG